MKLTLPQYDVYYEQLLYPNDPIYNIGAKIKIEGTIHKETFQKAYAALIRQHDAYRTIFTEENGEVVANIIPPENYQLEYIDFSDRKHADEVANAFMQETFMKPFDLKGTTFLHTFILIKVSAEFHYLFSVYHHIITDGWGTSLMFQRLVKNYNEILETGDVVSEYPFSYEAFVDDDKIYQDSEAFKEDITYWKNKFTQLPENLFEKKKVGKNIHKSSRKSLRISRAVYNEINVLAKQYKVSTFHFILGILYVYFGRKHQNHDFAIGLPVLNRSKSIFKKTVGLFMGVSALRMQLDMEEAFEEFVSKIRSQLRQDYRHQRLPLGKLIQGLGVFSEKEKIFNITLSYEKQNYSRNFGDTKTTVIPLTHQSERVALALYIREFDAKEDVTIDFDYNLNYFDADTIQSVTTHFETLLHDLLKNPTKKLRQLTYISEKEKQQLLVDFNQTKVSYLKGATFLDFFKKQVENLYDKVAVYDEKQEYTYGELDQESNQIAKYILSLTKEKNTTNIGVLVERSSTLITILLGILKAGKTYIPLDPAFPDERLQYIIDHSGLEILISDQPNTTLQTPTNEIISIENVLKESKKEETSYLSKAIGNTTAYIIYTSGSTGNPKGVAVGHTSLLNFLLSIQKEPGIEVSDTLFSVTTYSFDISILEFFSPLIAGATLYVANHKILASPETIIQSLQHVKPSIIQATPSFYQLLFNAGWNGSNTIKILCGGDVLSTDLASKLLANCSEIWNMYGPTETTIWSSTKQIAIAKDAINIGKPIANTQCYILDNDLQLLPQGTQGNLFIGGDGLALGYYKNSQLTDEKFIKNPFGNGLIYQTGDIAHWTKTGEMIFGGRNDNQVKIRGYRIELEDIETKLNALSTIKQAIVVPKKQNGQEAFLAAYIIPENADFQIENCMNVLSKQLPSYMIPSFFSILEAFPMTLNKKVDRKALIQAKINKGTNRITEGEITSELQKKLLVFWKETLHFEGIIHNSDNYFTLGGHSLNAVKLVYKINQELGCNITLKTVFEHPTILSLANYIEENTSRIAALEPILKATSKDRYQVTPSQYAIWMASQHKSSSIAYNMVAGFSVEGNINATNIDIVLEKLVYKHEILRTNFVEENGIVYQKIDSKKQQKFSVSVINHHEENVSEIIEDYVNTEFDLASDRLIKIMLIKQSEITATIIFCTHHIIMDGWSLEVFTKDFIQEFAHGETVKKATESIQFKDYSEWLLADIDNKDTSSFWENYLLNYQPKESFRTDINVKKTSNNGAHYNTKIDQADTAKMLAFVQKNKTTMHNFLVSALQILIYKVSQHTDNIIGTVNSGRNHPETNNIIGMFVKTLPLRTQLQATDCFESILSVVKTDIIQLDTFQDMPRISSSNMLFDVLVAFQNTDFSHKKEIRVGNEVLKPLAIDVNYNRLPLLFNFSILEESLHLQISYDSEKYNQNTIEWIWLKYQKLMKELIQNPLQNLSEIEISLPFESEDVVDIDFNF